MRVFPKALFLDRDGTLMVDKVYLADPAGVEPYPRVGYILREARRRGCLLFLFSNQSGIGRGYYTLEDALAVNARLVSLLGLGEGGFDGVCLAPEAPGQPIVYRKPSPRFILESLHDRGLRPAEALMVGDSEADLGAAAAAGISCVLLRSGKLDPLHSCSITAARVPIYEDFSAFGAHHLGL